MEDKDFIECANEWEINGIKILVEHLKEHRNSLIDENTVKFRFVVNTLKDVSMPESIRNAKKNIEIMWATTPNDTLTKMIMPQATENGTFCDLKVIQSFLEKENLGDYNRFNLDTWYKYKDLKGKIK